MTFQEIYEDICFRVYGIAAPDFGVQNNLQGANGLIARMHRQIQQDYNYWFMYVYASINVLPFSQTYILPNQMKQPISVVWAKDEGFSDPLTIVSSRDAVSTFWQDDDITNEEYPEFCEIQNEYITLYPDPNPCYPLQPGDAGYDATATHTLFITYWGFLSYDPATVWATYEDPLTIYGPEAIVNLVCAKLCDMRGEHNRAMVFKRDAIEATELLKKEHRRRVVDNVSKFKASRYY